MLEITGGGNPGKAGKAGLKGKTYRLIEFVSSPLTSGSWAGDAKNKYRYDIFPGETDRVGERHFSTLRFEGPLDDRYMTIRYFNTQGELLNQKEGTEKGTVTDASVISANWLRAPQRRK